MTSSTHQADVIIIGAGLSGLLAANAVQQQGKSVMVLDKGTSVGGRLATRRLGAGLADHGAQFFTVRDPEFQAVVEGWLSAGVVYQWALGWSDGSLQPVSDDGHPRYAAHGGMNAIARHIAQTVQEVRVNIKVTAVKALVDSYEVLDEGGQQYLAKALMMTPPAPQALALLDAGDVRLNAEDRTALEQIRYQPCLTGLFRLAGDVQLPTPGAIQRRDAPISWIANNKQKGISPDETIITVQADGDTSAQWWDDPDERSLNALRTDLLPWLPEGAVIVEQQLKRWRYSAPVVLHPARYLRAADLPPLVFAGDGFMHPRVEGAALSGLAAAAALG
ncbi:MAG: FAD-dependent oxidoreductase [Armatimonadetes bacterium]|nr:FAD-dependent oxidoreductase [Anaerolineae bacterium]